MSCNWDIRCVDCCEEASIADANHEVEIMHLLVQHAQELANLAGLVNAVNVPKNHVYDVSLYINNYYVPLEFFAKHGTHHLRPVDEYGRFDTPCKKPFKCGSCNKDVTCEEREHDSTFAHGHWVGETWHRS